MIYFAAFYFYYVTVFVSMTIILDCRREGKIDFCSLFLRSFIQSGESWRACIDIWHRGPGSCTFMLKCLFVKSFTEAQLKYPTDTGHFSFLEPSEMTSLSNSRWQTLKNVLIEPQKRRSTKLNTTLWVSESVTFNLL